MKTNPHVSHKKALIDKSNSQIFISIAVVTFIVIFCFFAVRALLDQQGYHSRVINEKETALRTLENNLDNSEILQKEYVNFEKSPLNILSGSPEGTGPNDGTNSKIILDALPAVFDYPALSTSVEKILEEGGYPITSLGGETFSDEDEENTAVGIQEIPYSISTTSSVEGVRTLLETLQRSIRPFSVEGINFSGTNNTLEVQIQMKTFWQPGKEFDINTKVIE